MHAVTRAWLEERIPFAGGPVGMRLSLQGRREARRSGRRGTSSRPRHQPLATTYGPCGPNGRGPLANQPGKGELEHGRACRRAQGAGSGDPAGSLRADG
jgi:hypothetical protein